MNEQKKLQLSDLCESIDYGFTASASTEPCGPKFLRITDIVPGYINWSSVPFTLTTLKEQEKYKLHDGDIVIARTGATTGSSSYISNPPDSVFASYLVRLKIKPTTSSRFIAYFLKSSIFKNHIRSVLGDKSAQPNASAKTMCSVKLSVPLFVEQKAIASVLGILDDKIENNRQMNEVLEKMALEIFKSWFIDFDPVHAKVDGKSPVYLDSKTAEIFPNSFDNNGLPTEWEQRKIHQFANVFLGGTPSRNNPAYWGGDIPWINSGAVNKFRILEATEFITKEGLINSSTKLLPINTTVIAITGATLGQVSYLEIETCANQSVVGVIPNKEYFSEWVYLTFLSNIDRLISLQTGGAQQHINKNDVLNFNVIYPTEKIIRIFSETVRPLFQKIVSNLQENKTLSDLRDALLPKLMSGEIRVKDAEHEVEASL